MNRKPIISSIATQAAAAAVALGLTGFVLAGVDALAQQRTVSAYAQVVQLERVVVTGQRLAAASAAGQRISANDHCDAQARDAATKTC